MGRRAGARPRPREESGEVLCVVRVFGGLTTEDTENTEWGEEAGARPRPREESGEVLCVECGFKPRIFLFQRLDNDQN